VLNVQRRNAGSKQAGMTEPNHYDTAVKEFDDLYNAMLELLVDEYQEEAE
jgi:hypothetical protein